MHLINQHFDLRALMIGTISDNRSISQPKSKKKGKPMAGLPLYGKGLKLNMMGKY